MRQHFQESSLEYVCKLQEIQERKKFECVEPVSAGPFVQIVIQFDSFQHCLLTCLPFKTSGMLSLIKKKNSLSVLLLQNKCYKYTFLCILYIYTISQVFKLLCVISAPLATSTE